MSDLTSFDLSRKRGTPAYYRNWMQRANCSDADRQVLESACNSFEASYSHQFTDVLQVDTIAEAARHARKVIWEAGVLMLMQLAQSNATARAALTDLATDAAADNRARAMFYLSDQFPREYCLQLLHDGTIDRSMIVAKAAADSALKLNLYELADTILLRSESVKKPEARLDLEMVVGLLQHGFFEYYNQNGYNIVVSFPDRYPNMTVWPGSWLVKEGDIHALGIQKIRALVGDSCFEGFCREWQWPTSTQ